jgi:hypothetical protein
MSSTLSDLTQTAISLVLLKSSGLLKKFNQIQFREGNRWLICGPDFFIFKTRTGGSRPAGRHTFVRQQKYAKVPSPCGGHLFCRMSESSIDHRAQEAGPLQGAFLAV